MKVFTVAAALETTDLTPDSPVFCHNGKLGWFGHVIEDTHPYGWLTVSGVVQHSSNIGALQIGKRVKEAGMYRYFHDVFGFGRRTGIELLGESAGRLSHPSKWTPGQIGSISYGYAMSATMLQLARATAVIANGGMLVEPRLVMWMRNGENNIVRTVAPAPVRVLKPETAIAMRRMMELVILDGTGTKAKLAAFTAGGKTGTALIWDNGKRDYLKSYNGTFIGFAPLSDPRIAVVANLRGVKSMAGTAAAPVFKEVSEAALRVLGVMPDVPQVPPPAQERRLLAQAGTASPAIAPSSQEDSSHTLIAPRVPNYNGKSVAAVMRESAAQGLAVEMMGSGIARWQDPRAGEPLPAGRKVRVQFAR
jgi:cell division protein FtsI (penicillin-binding protein 3)